MFHLIRKIARPFRKMFAEKALKSIRRRSSRKIWLGDAAGAVLDRARFNTCKKLQ